MIKVLSVVLFLISSMVLRCDGARILAVFPYPSKSHAVVFNTVVLELARRGHDLVVFTADPITENVPPNLNQIDMSSLIEEKNNMNIPLTSMNDFWFTLANLAQLFENLVSRTLSHPEMTRLIAENSTEKFDLVMMHWAMCWGISSLAHRFSAPLMGINTVSFSVYSYYTVGNPLSVSYIPDMAYDFGDAMSFWERFWNALGKLRQLYYLEKHLEAQDRISKKYLGSETPHVRDTVKNVSMVLRYSDPVALYPEPVVPAIVEIGGIHIRDDQMNVQLPKDLQSFLDEARDGFIYFSLGSTFHGSRMTERTRNQFLEAFAELPYKVLWKWENDTLPGKPNNVFVSKWLPQRVILTHPNIKVFLYQGGLQSTEETMHHGVPIVGIPLFLDQKRNLRRMESSSLGKVIRTDITSIEKEEIKAALLEVISDSRYTERMRAFSEIRRDRPQDVLEKAIWWIEHVIRHKGARHLRLRAMDLTWYQLHCIDIALVVLIVLFLFVSLMYWITKHIVIMISNTGKNWNIKTKFQ